MIIHVAADAPLWMRAAATTALTLHIAGGSAGLLSGAIGMGSPKGGRLHRSAGKVFVTAMLTMAAFAAITALLLPERGNIVGAAFTFYLVLTGWAAVRRPPGRPGRFECWAGVAALGIAVGAEWVGWLGSHSPDGMLDGQHTQSAVILGAVALLAAGLDFRAAAHGGLSGTPRLVRHPWRMCVAVFIAAGSFFLGQQQVFPAWLRGSPLLMIPALAPLAVMIVWQVKVRVTPARATTQPGSSRERSQAPA